MKSLRSKCAVPGYRFECRSLVDKKEIVKWIEDCIRIRWRETEQSSIDDCEIVSDSISLSVAKFGSQSSEIRAATLPYWKYSNHSLLMFLLDTNVVSELRKVGGGRTDASVVAWNSNQVSGRFYISVSTLMELEIGILRLERRDVE